MYKPIPFFNAFLASLALASALVVPSSCAVDALPVAAHAQIVTTPSSNLHSFVYPQGVFNIVAAPDLDLARTTASVDNRALALAPSPAMRGHIGTSHAASTRLLPLRATLDEQGTPSSGTFDRLSLLSTPSITITDDHLDATTTLTATATLTNARARATYSITRATVNVAFTIDGGGAPRLRAVTVPTFEATISACSHDCDAALAALRTQAIAEIERATTTILDAAMDDPHAKHGWFELLAELARYADDSTPFALAPDSVRLKEGCLEFEATAAARDRVPPST